MDWKPLNKQCFICKKSYLKWNYAGILNFLYHMGLCFGLNSFVEFLPCRVMGMSNMNISMLHLPVGKGNVPNKQKGFLQMMSFIPWCRLHYLIGTSHQGENLDRHNSWQDPAGEKLLQGMTSPLLHICLVLNFLKDVWSVVPSHITQTSLCCLAIVAFGRDL